MKRTGIADLKARLSHYLRRVKAGEEIVVLERNVPVARLVPVGARPDESDALRDLEQQGAIRLGSGKLPKGFWKLPRARDPDASVRQAISDEREEGP